jgi:hypothetical protein
MTRYGHANQSWEFAPPTVRTVQTPKRVFALDAFGLLSQGFGQEGACSEMVSGKLRYVEANSWEDPVPQPLAYVIPGT